MEHMSADHLKTGKIGEDQALIYLRGRGFKMVERNYWKPYGEIDIVAQNGGVIHFVEVKTLSGDVTHGTFSDFNPEDHMNFDKRQRQKRVIQTYLTEKRIGSEVDWQVDLVSVYLSKSGELVKIEAFEDIVLA